MNGSTGSVGSWQEKRFRFTYRVPGSSAAAVNTFAGKVSSEDRFCRSEGQCSVTTVATSQEIQDDDWTEWSKCSRECGGGYQIRVKSCGISDPACIGSSTIAQRACDTQPCTGDWGCWSTWTPCDRYNKKRRSRVCLASGGVRSGESVGPACPAGSSFEEIDCDGWGPWTEWKGDCEGSPDGSLIRTRSCAAEECGGSDRESKSCNGSDTVPAVSVSGSAPVNAIVGAVISGFLIGAAVGAGIVYYYLRYRKPGGANGSPHYVSAKSQNLYVSLPMLDLKHKHLSSNQSDCGTLRSTSTLRSKAGGSSIYSTTKHSDYETATIKRSHSHRNSSLIAGAMRADLDSDQLFT